VLGVEVMELHHRPLVILELLILEEVEELLDKANQVALVVPE
jgi:hypothetical protein